MMSIKACNCLARKNNQEMLIGLAAIIKHASTTNTCTCTHVVYIIFDHPHFFYKEADVKLVIKYSYFPCDRDSLV